MRSFIAAMVGATLMVGVAATAEARAVHYRSQHPLPRKIGHGFCYINAPHVHDFGPSDPRLYREVNGEYYFVGDPAPFDYDGPRYSFYGPHPVVEADVQLGQPIYCYLNGPHYHGYQPPPQAQFEFRGGAYWYVGNYDPVYYQDRPHYATVNEAYRPIAYTRPIVDVTVAPPSFHGEIVVGPGYPRGQAVAVGGPPVVSAGVTIGVPPPPQIQVGIGVGIGVGGPPVIVGGPPPPVVYERERHDNGRHNGWYKHEHEHGWRGAPPPQAPPQGGGWRGAPAPAPPSPQGGGWRGAPAAAPPHHDKHEHEHEHEHHGGAGFHR
jgi:hypothetical protein